MSRTRSSSDTAATSPRRRRRPSPALLISILALVVALAPPAYAALAKNSVGTPQLKTGAVTSLKVRNGNLRPVDLVHAARLDRVALRTMSANDGFVVSVAPAGTEIASLATHGGGPLTLTGPTHLLVSGGVYTQNTSGSTRTIRCSVTVDDVAVAFDTRAYLATGSGASIPVTASFDRPAGTYDVGVTCSGTSLHAGNLWVTVTAVPR